MTATTRRILSALASAAEGRVADLPLDPELYSETSLAATAAAFSDFCRVETVRRPSGERTITITVRPEHRGESGRVVGELLNYLLDHTVREIGKEERPRHEPTSRLPAA